MGLRNSKARRAHAPDAGSPSRGSESPRSKRGSSGRKRAARWPLRRSLYWSLVLGLWAMIAAVGTIAFAVSTLPPIQSLEVPKRPPTIEIVGTDGRPLVTRGEMSGTDVSIKELPPYLPKAFVAIEDRRFFSHYGIDPLGLMRAAAANVLRRGVSQGGSTITQQLAKNLFLTQQRTLWRKMQEVVLALWLERRFSKTEILELYLNRVYFGSGAYGVESAAWSRTSSSRPRSILPCRRRRRRRLSTSLSSKGKGSRWRRARLSRSPPRARCARWSAARTTRKANSTARSPPSASPAQRSSLSSISPRSNVDSRPRPCARINRWCSKAGSPRTTATTTMGR